MFQESKGNKEYEMLRQEILHNLSQYQNFRNMMYVVTATILGFSLKDGNSDICIFLLPLIVILPSYIVSNDQWKGTVKIATYLMVFHESQDCDFQWETYLQRFNSKISRKNPFIGYDKHKLPYVACSAACFLLYFMHIDYVNIFCDEMQLYIIIGLVFLCLTIWVFNKYKKVDYQDYIDIWLDLKK